MRRDARAVLVLVIAVACEKRNSDDIRRVPPPAPPGVRDAQLPVPSDAIVFTGDLASICPTAKQLVDRALRCAPRSADILADTKRSIEDGPAADALLDARERWAAICAGIAKAYDDQLAGADPACRLTTDERTRNDAFLAAYYGRRTKPRPTGDAVVDKNLADLAAARDALCACTDEECVRAAQKVVTGAVKPVPHELPAAMADAVAISDEVSRCADRIAETVARSRR